MRAFIGGTPFGVVIPRDEAETHWQPAPSHDTHAHDPVAAQIAPRMP